MIHLHTVNPMWTVIAALMAKPLCAPCYQSCDCNFSNAQADKIATGHNADDIAETVLLNIVRGDLPRLSRCAAIITGTALLAITLSI